MENAEIKLSIVVPAYNEESRLGRMLDAYLPYFQKIYDQAFELLVVVNGSRDATETVARSFMADYPQLRVLVEERAIGKGGAVMLGLARARGALIGFVDADGATPPAAFNALVGQIGDAGAVIASRRHPRSQISPRQPRARRAASLLFNWLVRMLFALRISDTQCGAKLMTRAAGRAVLPALGVTRWAFDVDLLFQLRRAGFTFIEVPTVWHDVSGSRLNILRASLEMFVAMVRLRLMYSPLRWVVDLYDRTLGKWIHPDDFKR